MTFIKNTILISTYLVSVAVYANSVPYCDKNQLSIYQVAVDHPGMMQSRSLYGIVNVSRKACRLQGTPAVWGIASDQKVTVASAPNLNGKSVIVEPLTDKKSISSNQLVWFSLHGSDASDGPKFKKIQIILPGIKTKIFTVPYDGYSSSVSHLSAIQKDAQHWDALKTDHCPGYYGKSWPIFFNATAECG
jgi:inner membrane protein involved in colicin E2 resistance